ncbi:hypothetical protein JOF56_008129 [Kibdelosporangium banguiense]|uniref:DNA-binding protein n=1 Tax=Kibdelosporangium banguiense TaxID=1365924 RepID=A0ABS4TUT8_9PSEU|nr:hypothetical protein [Kibdelosporangium banguiense]MBP2327744.1 hypothetical protein [Kibdelosporangium banguiense]
MASLRTIRALVFATLFTLLTTSLAAPAAVAAPTRVISIAKARNLPLGTVVTVNGTATTPSGAFESSFFDKGFGLQDAHAGIYVSRPADLEVRPGRLVRVTGKLADSFGLLILVPASEADVALRHAGFQPPPKFVATSAVGESTEGKLVRVLGKITQAPTSDLPYGYKFWINDGSGEVQIFVNVETGIDLAGLRLGQRVLVTGFSGQFETAYEVLPRSPHDIRIIH